MKILVLAAAILLPLAVFPQQTGPDRPRDLNKSPDARLPNGKLQQEEILKADHEKSIKEVAQLIDLAEGLKQDLERDDSHVLSLASLKKTEEIEKLARRIRTRLKRY